MSDELTDTAVDAGADAAADSTQKTDSTQTDDAGAAKGTETQTGTEGAQEGKEAASGKVEISPQAAKEIARLTRVIADRAAENTRLKDELKTTKTDAPAAKTTGSGTHPALQGLQSRVDSDGDTVYLKNGLYWPAEYLQAEYDRDQDIAELRGELSARKQAEEEAKSDKARVDLEESVRKAVTTERAKWFPNYTEARATRLDRVLVNEVDNIVSQAIEDGTNKPLADIISAAIVQVIEEERESQGVGAAAQLKNNAEHKTTDPVTPGQSGSQTPVDHLDLPRVEREKASKAATEAVMRNRPG
jgi:hypothetical protein